MAKVDLETKLRQFDVKEVTGTLGPWLALPSIHRLARESLKQVQEILNPESKENGVRGFIGWELKRIPHLIFSGQYQAAIDFTENSFNKAERKFSGPDIVTSYYYFRFLRGLAQEQLAATGPYKDHSLRHRLFLMAAKEYMEADRGIGVVTNIAGRVAQCAFGAGIPELGRVALEKLFEGRTVNVIGAKERQELEASATRVKTIGRLPFGGKVTVFTVPAEAFNSITSIPPILKSHMEGGLAWHP